MRSVVVTGGSRGLGLGIVRKLTAAGYHAIAVARRTNEHLAAAMEEACPESLHFVPFDLGEIERIPELVKRLCADFGPIYGLVNNAAVGTSGALTMMHVSHIEQLIRINVHSPIVLTKCVVRHMMTQGAGRVVNIASIVGFTGYKGLSVYGATKASMIGFTRSLSREVGPLGITVNSVAPGFLDTEMTAGLGDSDRERIVRRSALRRPPEVGEVADAVEFLLGDRAKSITGTVLTVDSGTAA